MEKWNVLIVTFDCLRPDRLSGAGYRGVSTPTFDRLMAESVTFANAYCQGPNTWMSHASLFTGCSPCRNGIRTPGGKIPTQLRTMAELFQQAGYDTFGLPALSLLGREAGFARGFREYRLDGMLEETKDYSRFRTCADTLEMTRTWLKHANRPFFAWIHYFGTHWAPTERLDLPVQYRRYSEYAQFYDGKVAYADEQFLAPLVDYLDALGLLDQTVLVLWSDHGENLRVVELKEHGLTGSEGHNWWLSEDVMRIFLLIRAPGLLPKGHKRTDVCQSIDILPTLLEMTGLKSDIDQIEGRSLISASSQNPAPVYMENLPKGLVGVRHGRYKLVLSMPEKPQRRAGRVQPLRNTARQLLPYQWQQWWRSHRTSRNTSRPWWTKLGEPAEVLENLLGFGVCELYDLETDPDAKNNIAGACSHLILEYKDIIREAATRSINNGSPFMPEEEAIIEDRLRALGYF